MFRRVLWPACITVLWWLKAVELPVWSYSSPFSFASLCLCINNHVSTSSYLCSVDGNGVFPIDSLIDWSATSLLLLQSHCSLVPLFVRRLLSSVFRVLCVFTDCVMCLPVYHTVTACICVFYVTAVRPVLDWPKIYALSVLRSTRMHHVSRVRIAEFNENFACGICFSYIIDATTIVECLHSCKNQLSNVLRLQWNVLFAILYVTLRYSDTCRRVMSLVAPGPAHLALYGRPI